MSSSTEIPTTATPNSPTSSLQQQLGDLNIEPESKGYKPFTFTTSIPPLALSDIAKSTIANQRSEFSLIQPKGIPRVFRLGIYPCSVIYLLPSSQIHLQTSLHKALRVRFPRKVGLALATSQPTDTEIAIEVALCDDATCKAALSDPITVGKMSFPAHPAVSSTNSLVKVSLSHLPPRNYHTLRDQLTETFQKHGEIRDIVLYEDDISGSWFCGNGHVYLERKPHMRPLNGFNIHFSTTRITLEEVKLG